MEKGNKRRKNQFKKDIKCESRKLYFSKILYHCNNHVIRWI